MAEVYLQQLEKTIIKHLIDAKILSFYTRYVGDIFRIYDSTCTNPDTTLQYTDTIHSNIQLSPTLQSNNVNFLGLSITRKPTCLGVSIYRKPTTTDTTINFLSNHPLEHKMAAYWFLIRRMLTLPIDREQQYVERQHILHIAHSNNIPPIPTNLVKTQNTVEHIPAKIPHPHLSYHTKWATFMYSSPQIRKVTNIFKHTNTRIAFKCNNTISQLPKPINKTHPMTEVASTR
jgi:hypothetical protein